MNTTMVRHNVKCARLANRRILEIHVLVRKYAAQGMPDLAEWTQAQALTKRIAERHAHMRRARDWAQATEGKPAKFELHPMLRDDFFAFN